jgi:perosamine synthetase
MASPSCEGTELLPPTTGVAACGMVYNRAISEAPYRGTLCAWDDLVPFATTRMNHVYDVPVGAERGGHAHTLIHELCVCPVGSMTVTVEDGSGVKSMTISCPTEGVHIAPGAWITLHDFAPGTVLVILCSGVYDPKECMRSRTAFDERYGPPEKRVVQQPPPFIPVNTPALRGDERKLVADCIDTGWISSEGSYVKQFEEQMASYVGRKYAIAVANGTAAIDIAVDVLGIGAGDEVILPTFTIISCASQIARCGATPVVVDADESMNMDVSLVERLITPRTKAIMCVHIYHFACDMQPLLALATKYNLYLIEDAAEMIGQTHRGRQCGSFGHISTMSFYPNKHVTTGEGGMVLTDSKELHDKAMAKRNLSFGPPRRFVHHELGWNYRLTNMQAALGCAQLAYLDQTVARKRQIGRLYSKLLAGTPGLLLPPDTMGDENERNIYWVYGIVLEPSLGVEADVVTGKLGQKGIGSRPFFWCMHEQVNAYGTRARTRCTEFGVTGLLLTVA